MPTVSKPTCKNCHCYIDRPYDDTPVYYRPALNGKRKPKMVKWCTWCAKNIKDFGKDVSGCCGYLTQDIVFRIRELRIRLRKYERAVELVEFGKKKWANARDIELTIGRPYIIRTVSFGDHHRSEPTVCDWTEAGWRPVAIGEVLSASCFTIEVLT